MTSHSISPQKPPYRFTETQDWFSFNEDHWRALFKRVSATNPRALEIGSWEGRSAVFLLTELCGPGGELVCIDHFDLMQTEAGKQRYATLTGNLSLTNRRFRVLDEFSVPGLMTLLQEEMSASEPGFDWVYVDGSHEADDTLLDGELAWRLARKGAIVIFDDYHWNKEPEDSMHHPKRGIDAFLTLHSGEYTLLSSPTQYQVVLQKATDMRIGFLTKDQVSAGLDDALGYGIHIALTIDDAYAMPAAVAIKSAVSHTSGRLTFYVVHRDLSEKNQDLLKKTVAGHVGATVKFVELRPEPGEIAGRSLTWAKIDMVPVLPVERVLYLDADVLVRGDLRPLWDFDLKGKPIAAAADVGFPMGHDGVERGPYFNAGVLLMDLSAIRADLPALQARAASMERSAHRDQDALNTHFVGNWARFSLKWNAQGLGTYAQHRSADRDALDLGEMEEPSIVHFTGPVHPDMAAVLNPYVQPYTAKPWGFAGAPGHPFAQEWDEIKDLTAWAGWRSTDLYDHEMARAEKEVIEQGVSAFRERLQTARG